MTETCDLFYVEFKYTSKEDKEKQTMMLIGK